MRKPQAILNDIENLIEFEIRQSNVMLEKAIKREDYKECVELKSNLELYSFLQGEIDLLRRKKLD